MRLAHILDDMRCSGCGAVDVLWLDPVRGIVECRECGEKAFAIVGGLGPADLLDPVGCWDGDE